MVGASESVDINSMSKTILTNATGQYFPVVLFTKLYKVVLSFASLYKMKSLTDN